MTTPTDKDAMALAVFDLVLDGQHTHSEIIEARAHLASRIAELEHQVSVLVPALERSAKGWEESLTRATRAEAELAAVREDAKDAQHVIWLLLRSNGGALTISAQAARELDPGQAAIERTTAPSGEVALRAIDAARGGE